MIDRNMRMSEFYSEALHNHVSIHWGSQHLLQQVSHMQKDIDTVSISKAVTAVDRQYIQAELRVDVFKAVCKMTHE